MSARVRAPELSGRGGWLNTRGPLSLADLRGRVVILDFWTFCCVNCLHVLDELRPLESEFADCLVVVGVHSPKFAHEADHSALAAATRRHEVAHPVLDDPDLTTWGRYAVRAWPTLVVVDPEGYVVGEFSGEGHAHALRALVSSLVTEHEARGTLRRGDGPYLAPPPVAGDLTFPTALTALEEGLLVSDTGSHTLALLRDGAVVMRVGAVGQRGLVDGPAATARLSEPGGVAVLPDDVAAEVGYRLVVADTVNHALRGVAPDWSVRTVAGSGRQWMRGDPVDGTVLSSPWDCVWWPELDRVVVAMAGTHQLWTFDPRNGRMAVLAGTTQEGMVDGEATAAWLAQPSGLAVDGATLWFVDAETSSLRRLRNGLVHSEAGSGLFDFGHVDGPAARALLQHPLGVAVLPDGGIAVCDTYNGAIRLFDPSDREVSTLAAGLDEPTGMVVEGDTLVVAESAGHRVTRVPLPDTVLRRRGERLRTRRPTLDLRPGPVTVEVVFTPPPGEVMDERFGPASYVMLSASPPQLLAAGAGGGEDLVRVVELEAAVREGVIHVSARAASCDHGEFPACHVHQQDWGVPVRVAPGGADRLTLPLGSGEIGR